MGLGINYLILIVGLAIAGGLWILVSTDPEVRKRSIRYAGIFLVWGILCYTAQYFLGWGAGVV